MGMKMATPMGEVEAAIKAAAERAGMLTARALSYLGEQCVAKARNRPGGESWFDQTGNLRSSVGYAVAIGGRITQCSGFSQVKQGSEGPRAGKDLAEEIARKLNNGYALVVVAGMNYAELVEAMDNKDVLASTELWARGRLPGMLEKLERQVAG